MKKRIYVINYGNDERFVKNLKHQIHSSNLVIRKEYYKDYDFDTKETTNEIMQWIKWAIQKSDFVVMNLNESYSPSEIEIFEASYANAIGKNIYIICDNVHKVMKRKTNPILTMGVATKVFSSEESCATYLNEYFLNV